MFVVFFVYFCIVKILSCFGIEVSYFYFIGFFFYLEFNYFVEYSKVVLIDFGGIMEEMIVMGIFCFILCDNIECLEIIMEGINELIGMDFVYILFVL